MILNLNPDVLVDYVDHRIAVDMLRYALDKGDFKRSVSNCHTAGMDSIVIYDGTATNTGMIRFFWAKKGGHKLGNLFDKQGHFTLGVHNHRYPIALVPLVGTTTNIRTEVVAKKTRYTMHEYGFTSKLADDDIEAIRVEHRALRNALDLEHDPMMPGDVVVMQPHELHTIYLDDSHSQGTAWMVIEGAPAGNESMIYSERDDLSITSKDLYLPLTEDRARGITEKVLNLAVAG